MFSIFRVAPLFAMSALHICIFSVSCMRNRKTPGIVFQPNSIETVTRDTEYLRALSSLYDITNPKSSQLILTEGHLTLFFHQITLT